MAFIVTRTKFQRKHTGSSLVELMIACVLSAFVSTLFLAVIAVNFKTNGKVTNMQENISSMRAVKERIGKDVREGRSLGDITGSSSSDQFPSTLNPLYSQGPPPYGWPSAWPSPPYQLSNQCLIVQVPITDNHQDTAGQHGENANAPGWPTMIASGQGNPPATQNTVNVETHVYYVLPDPNNTGEWTLQYCAFPGQAQSGNGTAAGGQSYTYTYNQGAHQVGPIILAKGIVGPLDSQQQPKVFQFLDKITGNAVDTPIGDLMANYTGVIVNLEIKQHQSSIKQQKNFSLQPIGFKTEVFMRNNAMATPIGVHQTAEN
jgi:hypothetical protein